MLNDYIYLHLLNNFNFNILLILLKYLYFIYFGYTNNF